MADDATPPLGPISIFGIASEVAHGTADPTDARRLLAEFVRQAAEGNVETPLIDHVRDCFAAYLQGKRQTFPPADAPQEIDELPRMEIESMEEAFGIARGRGQPRVADKERAYVAIRVLEARLAGKSSETAIGEVADARKDAGLPIHGDTEVRKVWRTHRVAALLLLAYSRGIGTYPWTDDELIRLRKIYKGVQLNFGAEKSANTPP